MTTFTVGMIVWMVALVASVFIFNSVSKTKMADSSKYFILIGCAIICLGVNVWQIYSLFYAMPKLAAFFIYSALPFVLGMVTIALIVKMAETTGGLVEKERLDIEVGRRTAHLVTTPAPTAMPAMPQVPNPKANPQIAVAPVSLATNGKRHKPRTVKDLPKAMPVAKGGHVSPLFKAMPRP